MAKKITGKSKAKKKNIMMFFSLLLLALAIPGTVFLAKQVVDIRQHADQNQATITVLPPTAQPGSQVTIAWTLGTLPIDLATSPNILPRGKNVTILWTYQGKTPQPNDFLEVFTSSGVHVGTLYPNSCTPIPATTPPPTHGECNIDTANYGPDTYIVKIFPADNTTTALSQTVFVVTSQEAAYNLNGTEVNKKTYAFSNLFSIPKAYAQSAFTFTGGETVQLYMQNGKTAGKQFYLHCEEKIADKIPPLKPILFGNCQYPLSPKLPNGLYMFRIYAADGTTFLGESAALEIQSGGGVGQSRSDNLDRPAQGDQAAPGQAGPVTCSDERRSEEYSCRDGYRCYNDYYKNAQNNCVWSREIHPDTNLWYHCDRDAACGGPVTDNGQPIAPTATSGQENPSQNDPNNN